MASALKILATPIGNLGDISLRAVKELGRADLILAEDTRLSLSLIKSLGIALKPGSKLVSCDSHKELSRASLVIERLEQNHSVVLVSDAGCPGLSDPGSLLAQEIIKQGLKIEVIPGPSALTAALMGAGIDITRFAFLGFLPKKKSARAEMISSAYNARLSLVIYESPLRVKDLLDELFMLLGPARVVIARELTKIYETFHRGILGQCLEPEFIAKGECVVIIEAGEQITSNNISPDLIADKISKLLASGFTNKDIIKIIISEYKIKKSQAYDLVLKIVNN